MQDSGELLLPRSDLMQVKRVSKVNQSSFCQCSLSLRKQIQLDRMVDRVKPWFMVHGFVLGSVYDSVHGSVNGLVHGFVHDSWFILTF